MYCERIKTVTLPSPLTAIHDMAFEVCSSLESVNIPYGVTKIGKCAFGGCDSLTEITMPATIQDINPKALFYSNVGFHQRVNVPTGSYVAKTLLDYNNNLDASDRRSYGIIINEV